MKMRNLKALVLAMGLVGAMQAQALEAKWDLGMGWDTASVKLYDTTYTNGDSAKIIANEGFSFTLGAAFANDEAKNFETTASIGTKFSIFNAKNGSLKFLSYPLSVMQFYRPNDIRLGLGLTYFAAPSFKLDVPNEIHNGTYEYDSPLGFVAQIGYAPKQQNFAIDLRYTSVKFQQTSGSLKWLGSNLDGRKVDGSGVGFQANFRF